MLCIFFGISYHELWGDELHSWNIANASSDIGQLIANTRYEGHPPLWYILLFLISKLTHDPFYIQILQVFMAAFVGLIFLLRSPFVLYQKALILFGYYFIYEYGILSRNYSIAILFAFLICTVLQNHSKHRDLLYYTFLLLLCFTHLLGIILAASFHFYYLIQKKQKECNIIPHVVIGLSILLFAFYFILPPSDSALNNDFWIDTWSRSRFVVAMQAPIKALSPIPAWWELHFWNTHFLLQAQQHLHLLKFIGPIIALVLLFSAAYIVSKNKTSLLFFITNVILTLGLALIFPLTSARYVGFIFIGLIIALWLSNTTLSLSKLQKRLFTTLLFLQLLGGILAYIQDLRLPFSYFNEVSTLMSLVPKDKDIVTDYWCLNYLTAATNRSFYTIGFDRQMSFLLWDKEMSALIKSTDLYSQGLRKYFKGSTKKETYLFSTYDLNSIQKKDPALTSTFTIELVQSRTGAIEKGSNIYLYKIAPLNSGHQ